MAEASAKSKRSKNPKLTQARIIDAYKEYTLNHGHTPVSVFLFTKELSVKEETFYEHFGSFDAVEKSIWSGYILDTISHLQEDETYAEYSTREKLLSFYFALIELMKKDRSFIKHSVQPDWQKLKDTKHLNTVREHFTAFVQDLIAEGMNAGEIENRPVVGERYKDGLWLQLLFIVSFWLKDDSARFTKTDAAIEKSVNLSYDLMGVGPLDRIIDFTKFIWQNK